MLKNTAPCLLLCLTLTAGCDAMGDLALRAIGLDIPEASTTRVGVYPADGTMAWRGAFEVAVFLTDPADIDQLTVEVDGETGSWQPICALDGLGQARCPIAAEVPEEQDFTIRVHIGEHTLTSDVTSRVPDPGRSFRFSEGLTVTRAGADGGAIDVLEGVLTQNQLGAVLTNGQDGSLLFGAADYWDDGVISLDSPGLTMPLPLSSRQDGVIETAAVDVFLPITSAEGVVQLRLLDCSAAGFMDAEGLHFELSAILAGESLATLAASLGLPESAIYGVFTPDEDLDGDGELESVRVELVGDSPESPLRAWTEG